jgi:hypothetical protein
MITFQQQIEQARAKAFNVALTLSESTLQEFNNLLNVSMKNGDSFAEFQRRLSEAPFWQNSGL